MAIQTITATVVGASSVLFTPAVIRGAWTATVSGTSAVTAVLSAVRFGLFTVAIDEEQNYIFPEKPKAYDAIFVKDWPLTL